MKPVLDFVALKEQILRIAKHAKPLRKYPRVDKLSESERRGLLLSIEMTLKEHEIMDLDAWRAMGFRVVRGSPSRVMHGCFCKKADAVLKEAEVVGEGAYGIVHKSKIPRCVKIIPDEEWVAIKIETLQLGTNTTPQQAAKALEINRKAHEAGVAPAIYDTFLCTEGKMRHLVKVMELVEGIPLAKWNTSPSERKKAHELFVRKVDALASMGIIHSDVHENNIMVLLNDRGKLVDMKFIDFDFAKYTGNYDKMLVEYKNQMELYLSILEHLLREGLIVID